MIHDPLTRRTVLAAGTSAIVAAFAGCSDVAAPPESPLDEPLPVSSAIQYVDPACSCCEAYAPYLEAHLDGDLAVEVTDELEALKSDLSIPRELRSCHTVALDGYVFEGHLPVESIDRFLADEPDSSGIALPGMPAGSPGMGGRKDGTWTIYEFDGTGEYDDYDEV